MWAGVIQFWIESDGGLLEHNNELSGSAKKGKFLE
jgi:hypothetical protein